MILGTYMQSRDNGFNFLRLMGALFVFYTHSYAIFYGINSIHKDILMKTTESFDFGTFGVNIFFIISGLLITMSLINNKDNLKKFIISRILRVYPAMFTMIFITLIVFFFMSPQSFKDFFTSSDTIRYFVQNNTLFFGVFTSLDGIFTDNYFKSVNGSLWTLPWELRMYLLIFLIYMFFSKYSKFITLILAICTSSFYYYLVINNVAEIHPSIRFASFFLMGSTFFYFKDIIVLKKVYFILIIVFLLVALYLGNRNLMYFFNIFLLPYFVIYIAYRILFLRIFNNMGDYSYGIYIYSFPIQQIMVTKGMTFSMYFFTSLAVVFLMAALSWHLVEKKALSYKKVLNK